MIRRIVLGALVVASFVLIARIQNENLRVPVNGDPIIFFVFPR